MIYGDNPQKINEREDELGLKHYSYAPELLSIIQSGNLYVYCANNPVRFADRWGSRAEFAATCIWQGCMGIEDLFIYSQTTCAYAEDYYGVARIKDNGCGIIAVYNALVQIGKPRDFNLIKLEFILGNFMIARGLLGTWPGMINFYLNILGVETTTYRSTALFEDHLSDGTVFIVSYAWFSAPPVRTR